MELGSPWALWFLLLVPACALAAVHRYRQDRRGLRRLVGEARYRPMSDVFQVKGFFSGLFFVLFVAAAVLALADPRGGRRLVEDDREGYDLVFLIDISRSMLARDEEPHRLGRAVEAARLLAEDLSGSRFAVVAFKGAAYQLLPLTADREALRLILDSAGPDLATAAGSNPESGIRAAVGSFREGGRYRAVVLLSDGEGLAGDAVAAAREAGERGIPIIPIAVGSEEGIPLVLGDGTTVRDSSGQPVHTRADRTLLSDIAAASGGRVYGPEESAELARDLLMVVKGLKGGEFSEGVRATARSLYPLFLSRSLGFLTASMLVRAVRWRGIL